MVRRSSEKESSADSHSDSPARTLVPVRRPGRNGTISRGSLRSLAVILTTLLVFWIPVRAWGMNWGATNAEVRAVLPGDAEMTHPIVVNSRAVTINAPASYVWPWIVQMGYKRAGWYSYDWIEWLLGCDDYVEGHSANSIHPGLQQLKRGDKICMARGVCAPVLHLRVNRYMVLGRSWAFILQPIDAQHTRLIVRTRHGGFFKHAAPVLGGILYAADSLLALPAYEPGLHFFMERKMMLGIKGRAERSWDDRP